ncbi:hypothetical protein EVAR_100287_1 [Eumeta japonica]|uniref:Uncharacterized protein n=1 Tax=Eumeta variegata TaxID=151549 RepID=A0A4C2A5F6_EUMVA|nr:hypothetical protein EVAR_100287_1 [Eumeta japonica]
MAFNYCLIAFVALAVQMTSAALIAAPGMTTCGCRHHTGRAGAAAVSGSSGPSWPAPWPRSWCRPPRSRLCPLRQHRVKQSGQRDAVLSVSNLLDGALPPSGGGSPNPAKVRHPMSYRRPAACTAPWSADAVEGRDNAQTRPKLSLNTYLGRQGGVRSESYQKAAVAMAAIRDTGFGILDHPSPLVILILFPSWNKYLKGQRIEDDETVVAAVQEF